MKSEFQKFSLAISAAVCLFSSFANAETKCDKKAIALANIAADSVEMRIDTTKMTKSGMKLFLSNSQAQAYDIVMDADCTLLKMQFTGDL